ncbi:hypothetical protein QJS04_geneDACA010986 [Acorus gramineus]|uniref:Uncharacterized protein n=1 Tax=Acorus gramineus TaxID=55184 RepID=A0AAV9BEX8_ACOGR|nr:hypothetical protein QJS04_geneDACA010986 [Acorus gramineus]
MSRLSLVACLLLLLLIVPEAVLCSEARLRYDEAMIEVADERVVSGAALGEIQHRRGLREAEFQREVPGGPDPIHHRLGPPSMH